MLKEKANNRQRCATRYRGRDRRCNQTQLRRSIHPRTKQNSLKWSRGLRTTPQLTSSLNRNDCKKCAQSWMLTHTQSTAFPYQPPVASDILRNKMLVSCQYCSPRNANVKVAVPPSIPPDCTPGGVLEKSGDASAERRNLKTRMVRYNAPNG